MQRLTISIDDELADQFERWSTQHGYDNRSEAVRDLLRKEMGQERIQTDPYTPSVATLTYLYDHHERTVSMRLMDIQHDHHDLTVSSTHAHLAHDVCMETVILKGPAADVRAFAQSVLAERGIRHGQLHLVPLHEV